MRFPAALARAAGERLAFWTTEARCRSAAVGSWSSNSSGLRAGFARRGTLERSFWWTTAALKTRVMDDVRDRNRVNPVAALVRLS